MEKLVGVIDGVLDGAVSKDQGVAVAALAQALTTVFRPEHEERLKNLEELVDQLDTFVAEMIAQAPPPRAAS